MEPTIFQTTLDAIKTGVTGNINTILPVAGGLFATMFGIKFIPKIIRKFAK